MAKRELTHHCTNAVTIRFTDPEIALINQAAEMDSRNRVSLWCKEVLMDKAEDTMDTFWKHPQLRHIPWDEALPRLLAAYPPPGSNNSPA